eukprot:gene8154-32242_t
MDALVAVVDATGCLPDNACPSAVPDAPASISFTFNNCGQAGTVGLIVQTDDSENNSGNWWERAPIPLTNTPETDIWTVELPFVGDNAAGNPVSVGLPTAHNRPYKFIVDGSESPVANQDLANNVCQIQYNERKLHYWESPSNYAGCIPDDDGNEACPVSAPDTLTYTFNACSAVETVGYQVATGDVEGVNKVTGGAFHWYERAPYAATNTEGNTWTLTFPLTIGDDTIAVPPIGSTYKILINGAYSEFDDNADLRCHGTYNERKLNVYDAPVDMIGCNTECPTTTPAPAPFEYADHHHCAVKGMKYVNGGDGTAVGRFVATAMDCQDECAAASDTCGFFNYDATAETCTLYDAALLPSGNNWFEEARGILTGGPDCARADALKAAAASIDGHPECFRNNAIYVNSDFGSCGGAGGVYADLSGTVYVASEGQKTKMEETGWYGGVTFVVEAIETVLACQEKCAAEEGCDFFDWSGNEGTEPNECWLKQLKVDGRCTVDNSIAFQFGK